MLLKKSRNYTQDKMNYGIIKKPLVSEKSFQAAAAGKFTFLVDTNAGKKEIADAVSQLFEVSVLTVNTTNYEGKIKRTKKGLGKRSDFKKAIVTLKKGQKIDLFEVEKEQKAESKDKKEKKEAVKENKDTTVTIRQKKK